MPLTLITVASVGCQVTFRGNTVQASTRNRTIAEIENFDRALANASVSRRSDLACSAARSPTPASAHRAAESDGCLACSIARRWRSKGLADSRWSHGGYDCIGVTQRCGSSLRIRKRSASQVHRYVSSSASG